MANNKLERTFDFLQKHVHYTDEDYVNHPEFKKIADFKIKHTEYWLFSDLYNLFGPQYVGTHERIIETTGAQINFPHYIKLPKTSLLGTPKAPTFHVFFSDHVMSIINNYHIKEQPEQRIDMVAAPDARLSRYACWRLLKQWPNMIFAQLYFLMPDATFKNIYDTSYKFSRLYQRQEVTNAEKIVNGIAHSHGASLHKFNQDMHKIFFDLKNLGEFKTNYDIKGTVFDYMGSQSLMARQQALNNAIKRYDYSNTKTFSAFMDIITKELILARQNMIKRTGRAPENDLSDRTISQILGELKKMERYFINGYAYQSLK